MEIAYWSLQWLSSISWSLPVVPRWFFLVVVVVGVVGCWHSGRRWVLRPPMWLLVPYLVLNSFSWFISVFWSVSLLFVWFSFNFGWFPQVLADSHHFWASSSNLALCRSCLVYMFQAGPIWPYAQAFKLEGECRRLWVDVTVMAQEA